MHSKKDKVLLNISDLNVSFELGHQKTQAVKNVNLWLHRGEKLAIVGESGSGKSVTCLSILNLLQENSSNRTSGSVTFWDDNAGKINLLRCNPGEIQMIRGRKISMVFQEPMSSLNPVRKCGPQAKEILDVHDLGDKKQRKGVILDLFNKVALADADRIYHSYPHELSGGQLQRVNIAMALAPNPDVIICDEPTTALDVTVQKQILDLLKELVDKLNIALIFVSHDLDMVAGLCDRVVVMFNGVIVEQGLLPDTFQNPHHSYTKALLSCKPSAANKNKILPTVSDILAGTYEEKQRVLPTKNKKEKILSVDNLCVSFRQKKNSFFKNPTFVHAVKNVSFNLYRGESLGIVGESGSGKSTIANCITGLLRHTSGVIQYEDIVLSPDKLTNNTNLRKSIQLIFQDPYSSLNPRMTVGTAIIEPISYHKIVPKQHFKKRMESLLEQVGLDISFASRYPHQLSGGQRQRVCIARALSVNPKLLVCDECVSALDVSVQAQILNLLDRLKNELDLSLIFISHDLSVVSYICERVLVMKDGEIVEKGYADQIISKPVQDYTKRLIASIPTPIA